MAKARVLVGWILRCRSVPCRCYLHVVATVPVILFFFPSNLVATCVAKPVPVVVLYGCFAKTAGGYARWVILCRPPQRVMISNLLWYFGSGFVRDFYAMSTKEPKPNSSSFSLRLKPRQILKIMFILLMSKLA